MDRYFRGLDEGVGRRAGFPAVSMLRALIVDDSAAMQAQISGMLRSCGFDCLRASNGVEALHYASRDGIDLIVTDLDMPEMDGFELLRLIHRGAFGEAPPPVVVCSSMIGQVRPAERPELLLASALVSKPLKAPDFLAGIRLAFGED